MGRGEEAAACGGQAETARQRGDGERRGIGFALLGVAGDVGCGEQRLPEQFPVDVRLVLPDVEHPFPAARFQRFAVHDLAARGVDDDRTGFRPRQQGGVGQVARRGVERRVEGYEVGLAGHLPERQEPAALPLLAGRVAAEDAESPRFGVTPHERSDVPHADDAQRPLRGLPPLPAGEVGEHGPHPLQHAPGVAAGGRRDLDAVRRAPRRVDVVESDGRRGNHPHARTFQQGGAAPRAGADHEGVGVADVGCRDVRTGEIPHLGERLQDAPQEGNGAVGDDFHGFIFLLSG